MLFYIDEPYGSPTFLIGKPMATRLYKQFKKKGMKTMVLCVNVRTKIKDLVIEYIEVVLKNGEYVNLNWDCSEIEREDDGFSAFYRGVYFGEEKAKDCISRLEDLSIACIGLYSEEKRAWDIHLDQLDFDDSGKNLIV